MAKDVGHHVANCMLYHRDWLQAVSNYTVLACIIIASLYGLRRTSLRCYLSFFLCLLTFSFANLLVLAIANHWDGIQILWNGILGFYVGIPKKNKVDWVFFGVCLLIAAVLTTLAAVSDKNNPHRMMIVRGICFLVGFIFLLFVRWKLSPWKGRDLEQPDLEEEVELEAPDGVDVKMNARKPLLEGTASQERETFKTRPDNVGKPKKNKDGCPDNVGKPKKRKDPGNENKQVIEPDLSERFAAWIDDLSSESSSYYCLHQIAEPVIQPPSPSEQSRCPTIGDDYS